MRLSDRYIGRQVLFGTLFAIILLSTILVMGSLFQSLRMLIVDFGAPLSIIVEFLFATIPFSLIYTVPWAFLSAVLLVFGRMSSDNELIGFRMAGLSLKRLSLPVFVLGAVLSALCLWLNLEVAPQAKANVKNISLRAFFTDPQRILSAAAEKDGLERLEKNAGNVRAYIDKSDGSLMEGMHLFQIPKPGDKNEGRNTYVHAMKAQAVIDNVKKEFRFHLYDALFETVDKDGMPKIALAHEAVPVVLPFTPAPQKQDPATMGNAQIRDFIRNIDTNLPQFKEKPDLKATVISRYNAEVQRRYASSFACLAFAFIGVPLGVKARRKDTSTGLIISLLIGGAYFICGMLGGKSPNGVVLANWAPNVVCVILGLYLLRRARFR
jgi:lipopolysaccharide export LptBFGC system permease protein LptF